MADHKLTAASTSSVVSGVAGEPTGDSPISRDSHRGDGGDVHSGAAEASRDVGRPDTERPRLICVVQADRANVLCAPARALRARTAGRRGRRAPDADWQTAPVGPSGTTASPRAHRRARPGARVAAGVTPRSAQPGLVQRMEPLRRTHEDTGTTDLVRKCLAVNPEAVSELWWRVSERVLTRLRLRLGQPAAEDTARHILRPDSRRAVGLPSRAGATDRLA